MPISHAFSNAIPDGTNTQIVRPSDWNSAHNFQQDLAGNTAGVSSVSGTNIVWAGGANITLSANGSTISIVGGAGAGADGGIGISAGANSLSVGTVVFSNSNGISFGLNGSTVTAAHNALTTARASNDAVGLNTAQSNVTWTVNSAGLSLDARGYAGTGTTFNGANLSGSMTVNSNGVQLSVSAGNYLTSQSNQNVTAGNGGFAFQTLSFSNVNGISFGTSAGSAITASHNAITTGRASNDGIGLNTAQTNVTWTVNSAGLSLNAAGYAGTGTTFNGANVSGSMTVNSVGVQLSLSAGAGGGETRLTAYAQSNTTQSSSGTIALSSLNFAGAGIASVGVTNGSVVISVPAGGGAGDGGVFLAAGTRTAGSNSTVLFSNSNGISFGLDAVNGSVMTASVDAGRTVSSFVNIHLQNTNNVQVSQSTSAVQPVVLPDLSASFFRLIAAITTNSTSFATTANTTFSMSRMSTFNVVLYSQNTGASSNSLASVVSGSAGATAQWSLGAGTAGSQYTVSMNVTYPVTGGTSSYSTSYQTSQTRFDISSNSITLFTGTKYIDIPLTRNFASGHYWAMFGMSTSAATQGTAAFSAAGFGVNGFMAATQAAATIGQLGANTNNSLQLFPGLGSFTTAGGGTTASLNFVTNVSIMGVNAIHQFQLRVT